MKEFTHSDGDKSQRASRHVPDDTFPQNQMGNDRAAEFCFNMPHFYTVAQHRDCVSFLHAWITSNSLDGFGDTCTGHVPLITHNYR